MDRPELFAVAGRPILHSLSPAIFAAAFRATGRDAVYTRLAVDGANEALRLARELRLRGMNVTSPLKEDMFPLLDRLEPTAEAIGAVNTVVLRDGEAVGWNTDPAGVRAMLDASGARLAGARVAVLGAGGAARAALHTVCEAGTGGVVVINRSAGRGKRTARDFGARSAPWSEAPAELSRADLVFSCLSTTVVPLDPAWLGEGQVVLDANYKSPLLADVALRAGCAYVGGRDWLLGQALAAYRAFVGDAPPADAMRDALANARIPEPPGRIALSGMMGTGKSAAAEWLASELGLDWIDTDELVERQADATIAELFASAGEGEFRRREAEMVARATSAPPAVIALGGGALLDDESRASVAAASTVFWLWADAAMCFHRARGATRPLLAVDDPQQTLVRLLDERRGMYASSADLIVDTGRRTPHQVACKILDEIVHTWPR